MHSESAAYCKAQLCASTSTLQEQSFHLFVLCRYAYELGAEPVLGGGFAKWVKRKSHRLSTNVRFPLGVHALMHQLLDPT